MSKTEFELEIAELKAANLKLQSQVELMETIINNLSEGVVATNLEGEFLVANTTAQEIIGMSPDNDDPKESCEKCETFYPGKTTPIPDTELPLYKAMQGETTDDVKLVFRNKSKPESVFVNVSGRPLYDETGDLMGGVIAIRDVTQLERVTKQLETTVNELQTHNTLMDTIFSSISDGVLVADKDGKYVMFNETAKEMADYNVENVYIPQASKTFGLFQPDGQTSFPVDELPLARALKGEQVDDIEILLRNPKHPDGIHTRVSGRPIYDENGAVVGGVSTIHDISNIKAAEAQLMVVNEELAVQSQLLQSIFDSIGDGVVVADETGRIVMVNPGARQIKGMIPLFAEKEEWINKYNFFYLDGVTPYPIDELPMLQAINGKSMDDVEMYINSAEVPDGVYFSISAKPLQDQDGNRKGGVLVLRNLTDSVRAEEALAQAFAQGRLEIMDTILHNIGNAINSVSVGIDTIHYQLVNDRLTSRLTALASAIEQHQDNFSDYIKNDPQGQKVLPFILTLAADFNLVKQQWEQTVERIRNRVGHIVDIIRTQNSYQGASTTRKDINLKTAISDAVKILQDSIEKRQIQIEIDCADAPEEIRIQESQFHQMLVNLIKNSVEAIDALAASGGRDEPPLIQIHNHLQGDFLYIDVTDNGIGIQPEDLKRIFSAGFTSKEHGSGLGLHSSANFVIGSGGEIQAFSDGKGTGATVRIMFRRSAILPKSHEG